MTEIGVSGLNRQGGIISEEFLKQLSDYPRFIRAMKEMMDNDSMTGAVLNAIEMRLRSVAWTVERGGDSEEDERAALYLETIPDDMAHSFAEFLSEWADTAPGFGFAPFEIVLKIRDGSDSRFDDGMVGVKKLAIRHPDTLLRWQYSDAGELEAMIQMAPPDYKVRTLPMGKLLLFRIRSRKASPQGKSLLRSAYVHYYIKKRIEQFEAIGVERDLAGIPVAWLPARLLNPNASAPDVATREYFKTIVRNIRRDEQEGLVFPLEYNEKGNKLFDFTLLSTGGTRQFDTTKIIDRLDHRIAMTALADVILVGQGKVGSYALASTKDEMFDAGCDAMLDGIEETLNRFLVPRLMRLNGFNVAKPPQLRHGAVRKVPLELLGKYLTALSAAGAPILPSNDGELERYLLREGNLPDAGLMTPEEQAAYRQTVEPPVMAINDDDPEPKPSRDSGNEDAQE
jgi:hypothetical protein